MDPAYKQLENALRLVYGYPKISIRSQPKTHYYVPYYLPESQSTQDEEWFREFALKVITDYPRTTLHKQKYDLPRFLPDELPTHPMVLKIWKGDATDIMTRARLLDINQTCCPNKQSKSHSSEISI
jgi:hypothetical protein